jgi:hypothetical protein
MASFLHPEFARDSVTARRATLSGDHAHGPSPGFDAHFRALSPGYSKQVVTRVLSQNAH